MTINIAYSTRTALSISTTEISIGTGTSTLTPDTTPGQFQLWVDASNVAAGDEFEVAVTEVVRASGTARRTVIGRFVGAQAEIFVSPALFLGNGWFFSLKKIAGTDRTFDCTVRSVT